MIIRANQMETFRSEAERRFHADLEHHLCKFAPELTRVAGRPNVKHLIDLGTERAKALGLTERSPQRFYLELMLTFGSHFESDPAFKFAAQILEITDQGDQLRRTQKLWDSVCQYLERINGPKNSFLKAALTRVRDAPFETYSQSDMPLDRLFCSAFFDLYPEKAEFVGVETMTSLVQKAESIAETYRMDSRRGALLLTTLFLLLGLGVARDPMYPWVDSALRNEDAHVHGDRSRLLYTVSISYIDGAIQTLSKRN